MISKNLNLSNNFENLGLLWTEPSLTNLMLGDYQCSELILQLPALLNSVNQYWWCDYSDVWGWNSIEEVKTVFNPDSKKLLIERYDFSSQKQQLLNKISKVYKSTDVIIFGYVHCEFFTPKSIKSLVVMSHLLYLNSEQCMQWRIMCLLRWTVIKC